MRILYCAALLAALGTRAAEVCSLRVAWQDSPPYGMKDSQGNIYGIQVDLVTEALRRAGCRVEFFELPWARALQDLEDGRLDVLPGTLRTSTREKFAFFSKPMFSSRHVLLVPNKANAKSAPTRLGDIVGTDFRLGVMVGAVYSQEYNRLLADPRFVERLTRLTSLAGGMRMLDAGRLDGLISDEFSAEYLRSELRLKQSVVPAMEIAATEGRVAFSRRTVTPELVDKFDAALQRMKREHAERPILERSLGCKLAAKSNRCD